MGETTAQVRALSLTQRELTESLVKLVAEVRRQNRLMSMNSFVAYLLFSGLLAGLFYTMYRRRIPSTTAGAPAQVVAQPAVRVAVAAPRDAPAQPPIDAPQGLSTVDDATGLDERRLILQRAMAGVDPNVLSGALPSGDADLDAVANAQLLRLRGDARGAARAFAPLVASGTAPPEATYWYALALAAARRPNQSAAMLRAFIKAAPSHEYAADARRRLTASPGAALRPAP